ncbi:MAG: hypothetical protein IE916_00100 [Epsilonproteobacteria bacterium]|nr:hypothetical protein [Campylobacterota bacterium]
MNKIESLIKDKIASLNEEMQKKMEMFVEGHSFDDIGKEFGQMRQYPSKQILAEIDSMYKKIPGLKEYCDNLFGKESGHVLLEKASKNYHRILGRIARANYGKSLVCGMTANKEDSMGEAAKELRGIIEEDGLPLEINPEGIESPSISRIEFLLGCDSKSEWGLSKDKTQVLANKKLSLLANICKWEVKEVKSIWEIYALLKEELPEYIDEQGFDVGKKFVRYLARKGWNVKDKKNCNLVRIRNAKENNGTPIYEVEALDIPDIEEYLLKTNSIIRGNYGESKK